MTFLCVSYDEAAIEGENNEVHSTKYTNDGKNDPRRAYSWLAEHVHVDSIGVWKFDFFTSTCVNITWGHWFHFFFLETKNITRALRINKPARSLNNIEK